MTFLVRNIIQRMGGGDIVRESRIEKNGLLIGRGTDCDVQVPDLAILLHHARLSLIDGAVEAEALGGGTLEIDGRIAARQRIDPARGARIVLGAHALTVGEDGEGHPVLTLQRVGALSDAADVKDETRVFSLAGTRLGKRALAWTMAGLILALFLLWPVSAYFMREPAPAPGAAAKPAAASIWQADAAWSSGPISTAHASLQNDCAACHQKAFVAVRDETCRSCHVKVHDHADADRLRIAGAHDGLPGKAQAFIADSFNLPEGRCASCHIEHEGPKGVAASKPALCVDCHAGLSNKLPDTGLIDASDFERDHPEFRPRIVVHPSFGAPATRRVSLSDKPAENSGLKFPHKLHLSATNGVARMAQSLGKAAGYGDSLTCASCHRPTAGGVGFAPIQMERDCAACHSLDFAREDGVVRSLRHGQPAQAAAELRDFLNLRGPLILANERRSPGDGFLIRRDRARSTFGASVNDRVRSIFQPGGLCHDCHMVQPPLNPASLAYTIKPVSLPGGYMTRARFSHADHDTSVTPCATCHVAAGSESARDVLLPGIAVCRDCHVGAHPEKGKVVSDCASCHSFHADAAKWAH